MEAFKIQQPTDIAHRARYSDGTQRLLGKYYTGDDQGGNKGTVGSMAQNMLTWFLRDRRLNAADP